MFQDESPVMIEWAFRDYLRVDKYFPRPSDIALRIAERKAEMRAKAHQYKRIDREAVMREQETPEWQAASDAARAALARIVGKVKI